MDDEDEFREVNQNTLSAVLTDTAIALSGVLESAKLHVKQVSLDSFMESKVGTLGSGIGIYFSAFSRLGISTKKALDNLLEKNFRYTEVQDAYTELDEVEKEWDSFLRDIDAQLKGDQATSQLTVGSQGPCSIQLTDARTARTTSLQDFLPKGHLILVLLRHFA